MEANRKKKKRNRHLSHRLAGVTGTLAVIAAVGLCMAFEFGVFRLLPVSSKEEEAVSQELLGQGSFYAEQIEDSGRRKQETLPEGNRAEEKRQVYLTFDDGPSKNTDRMLDILKEYDVKATFFVVGKTDASSVRAYKRIVEEGHTLGMHSYSHDYQELYGSLQSFSKDLAKLQEYLYDLTGVWSRYYRFPGGSSNTVSATDMQILIRYLNENGICYYDWNVASGDAVSSKLSAEVITQNCMTQIEGKKECMILFHDASDKGSTVDALPMLIEQLQSMEDTEILPVTDDTHPVQHVTDQNKKQ